MMHPATPRRAGTSRTRRTGYLALCLLLPAAPLRAQLPTARLDGLFPPGLKAGTDTEVTLSGTDLEETGRLLFSNAGLSAVPVEGLKFKITASAGMSPGLYEVRAAGRYGISASRLFAVGTLPEAVEPADNASPDKAFALTLPVTVNGTTGPDAADHFRFKAAKDQRLVLSCAAQTIDSALNAVISLHDAAGRELLSAHRTRQADAAMDFTAPEAGDYFIRVHDIAWQTGSYRLTVAAPEEVPAASSPPLAGDVVPAPEKSAVLDAPAAGPQAAHQLTLPAAVTGSSQASRDWFQFTGSRGRTVMIDLLSHRNGQPSDWVMQIFKITGDDKGAEKSEQAALFDDTAAPPGAENLGLASRDPSGSLVCEEGVIYRIQLTDRFNARKPWQLVLRDPRPGFSLLAFSVSPVTRGPVIQRWSPLLRKGGSSLVQIAVLRRDGFNEPVTLKADGLPPGVTAAEVTVPAGLSSASLVLRADSGAKAWSGRIQITGTSGETTVTADEAVPRWNVANSAVERAGMRLSRDGFVLAVNDTETAPLDIAPAEAKVYESAPGGSIEVPVTFVRDASLKGIKGEWEASLSGLPGLKTAPVVKPAADAKDAKLVLPLKNADGNQFLPGTWTFHATARATLQWQPGEKTPVRELVEAVYSAPLTIKIEPSPIRLTAPETVTVAPGAKTEAALTVERRYGFTGPLTVEFAPPAAAGGLTAEKLTIAPEAGTAALVITAPAGAAPGRHQTVLHAKCSWNGQEIPWSIHLNVEVKP